MLRRWECIYLRLRTWFKNICRAWVHSPRALNGLHLSVSILVDDYLVVVGWLSKRKERTTDACSWTKGRLIIVHLVPWVRLDVHHLLRTQLNIHARFYARCNFQTRLAEVLSYRFYKSDYWNLPESLHSLFLICKYCSTLIHGYHFIFIHMFGFNSRSVIICTLELVTYLVSPILTFPGPPRPIFLQHSNIGMNWAQISHEY